jgi:RNA polymerase sigma-70 factor, ECF subfamily
VSDSILNRAKPTCPEGLEIALTDEQLVRAAVGGDLSAFETLVGRHWNMAVALALTRIADPSEAEDIAQESFLRAHAHLSTLREASRFAGWLSRIVAQQCSTISRKRFRREAALGETRVPVEALEAMPEHSTNHGLTESQLQVIQDTVRKLPERFRILVVMRFVAGLSSAEIGEQLGQRPGAVRVGLHRAYHLLRRDLATILEEIRP